MLMYICLTILLLLIGMIIGFVSGLRYANREIVKMHTVSLKYWTLYEIAVRWIKNPQKINEYMKQNGYKRICVYGMSHLGDCLVKILKENGIEVVCGIDKNADNLFSPYLPVRSLEDNFPAADLIIVTAIMYFEQIKSELETKIGKGIPIISLEEILQ